MAYTKSAHRDYINSDAWRERRKLLIQLLGSKCANCFMPRWLAEIVYDQDINVHHKHYRSVGHETINDVELLCRRCHEIETFGRSELRAPKQATCQACGSKHFDYRSDVCASCDTFCIQTPLDNERLHSIIPESSASLDVFCYQTIDSLIHRLEFRTGHRCQHEFPQTPTDIQLADLLTDVLSAIPGLYDTPPEITGVSSETESA